jgi:hypothetical protein
MIFLALTLSAMYAYAPPNLGDVAKPRWLDNIGVFMIRSLAPAKPEAGGSSIDPVAASNVDEDLDYRIAQRMKSTEGWRAFLAAHPDGPHAQAAHAELDQLAPVVTSSVPAAPHAPDGSAQTPGELASPHPSSATPEVATLPSDEICRRDEDRLEQLVNSPTHDEAMRFLTELGCEKLRPQVLRLAERQDEHAPTAVASRDAGAATDAEGPSASVAPEPAVSEADHGPSAGVSSEPAVSTINPPLPPRRAAEPANKPHATVASRGLPPRRRASDSKASSLPPILLALFGEHQKISAGFRRTRAGGRFGPNGASQPAPRE